MGTAGSLKETKGTQSHIGSRTQDSKTGSRRAQPLPSQHPVCHQHYHVCLMKTLDSGAVVVGGNCCRKLARHLPGHRRRGRLLAALALHWQFPGTQGHYSRTERNAEGLSDLKR